MNLPPMNAAAPKFGLLSEKQEKALEPFKQEVVDTPRPQALRDAFGAYEENRSAVLDKCDQIERAHDQEQATLRQAHIGYTGGAPAEQESALLEKYLQMREHVLKTEEVPAREALMGGVNTKNDAAAVLSMMIGSTVEFGDSLFNALSRMLRSE